MNRVAPVLEPLSSKMQEAFGNIATLKGIAMNNEEALQILRQIAETFSRDSSESQSLEMAAQAMVFCECSAARDKFLDFIKNKNRPLNGYEILQLKTYGVEIPEEYRTPDIVALESEIDALAAKILARN